MIDGPAISTSSRNSSFLNFNLYELACIVATIAPVAEAAAGLVVIYEPTKAGITITSSPIKGLFFHLRL
jgi:hypothetical protein